ncbi:MAG: ABC transporter permease [Burkholderiaceae bacterium]
MMLETSASEQSAAPTFRKLFFRNKGASIGLVIFLVIAFLALAAPILFPFDPFSNVGAPFEKPFSGFLLGTDQLGRDVAAGLAHGARTSLLLALLATFVSLCVGTLLCCLSGYYGGWVDQLLMRITEFFQTIPSFVFAIVLVAIMQPSIESIVIAIAVVTWPPIARLVRGEMLTIRRREFVEACICLGMRDAQIIFREILPNILSPIIVTGSLMVATAILIESALAFLGLGDPNIMSWGFMIGAGRSFLRDAWWLCAIPGLAILLTVLSINLIGEGLNDALNPRLRKM